VTSTGHRVGIDIGGTFTDFSFWHGDEGRLSTLKVPTVRARPVDGVMAGLRRLASEQGVKLADLRYVVHGTTIALNTLIERDGASLGLLVTRGFGDLLMIQRLRMPMPYNWRTGRPVPLLPRRHVFEIGERVGPDGGVETPLSNADVLAAAEQARRLGLRGLVVCFLHAYRQPAHEQAARELLQAAAPDLFVCCSHEIWPRMREYERAIVSIMNGYVMPKVDAYLGDLEQRLADAGVRTPPFITQSAGGIVGARSARKRPVDTLLSGPAAGVIGAVREAARAGIQDFITLDIGGTSADVAFVNGGRARISQSEHVADFPLLMPVIGVSSIGAGGGSVLAVDDAGVLRIGPASVGADPGPACYGKGGELPAVTDACVAGGYIHPAVFAGGSVPLSREKAVAVMQPIARALGRDMAGAVEAVMQVAVGSLYGELSNLAARQGVSVRDYALLPFGGAGPLLATRVADELGMDRVLVPARPGTLCSLGALLADVSKPFVRSIMRELSQAAEALAQGLEALTGEARAWLDDEAPELRTRRMEASADMRYHGQSYEIDVELDTGWIERADMAAIAAAFHARHRAMFAHADEHAPIEIVDLRLTIVGETEKGDLREVMAAARGDLLPEARQREVVIDGHFVTVPVHDRLQLPAHCSFDGPAIVEQSDTTTVIGPGWAARVHPSGALVLERKAT
jgi:N-methylhydantoinase A